MKISETEEIRPFVENYCKGEGLDIGCGIEKITPDATGIDFLTQYNIDGHPKTAADFIGSWEDYFNKYNPKNLDYIFSSHLLEDHGDIEPVLDTWLSALKIGGYFILYLPIEDKFKEHCEKTGQLYNFSHKQNWKGAEDFINNLPSKLLNKISIQDMGEVGAYSFYVIMSYMPFKRFIEVKNKEEGYDESVFTEDYWLNGAVFTGRTPRIEKSYKQVIDYITDLKSTFNPVGSVIDIGAGAGVLVKGLIDSGIDAYGCEFSSSGRKLAMERFGISLDPCDLRGKLPYEDNKFDFGVCVGVLSMVPRQYMPNAISDIFRVIKHSVMIYVLTIAGDPDANPHHITGMDRREYWNIIDSSGAIDITSLLPPQDRKYSIGILDIEFCGLFAKSGFIC